MYRHLVGLISLLGQAAASSEREVGANPGTAGMLIDLVKQGPYYTVAIEIGSNNQPGTGRRDPDDYFVIDLETSGLFVTDVDIDYFDGEGVFDPSESDTYVEQQGKPTTAT